MAEQNLFGLGINNNPDTTKRLAYGKLGAVDENITIAEFFNLVKNAIGALLAVNNLDELPNKAEARANLSVYSITQINNLLASFATILDDGTGPVVGINHEREWAITSPFQPVHKQFVENVFSQASTVAVDYAGNDADFNSENINVARFGALYLLSGTVRSVNFKSSPVLLCTIPGYSNSYAVQFIAQQNQTSNLEGGYGFIQTNGDVYFKPGKGDNQTWNISAPAIVV